MDKTKPERDAAAGAPNALDSWLRRELQGLYGDPGRDELPAEIAGLAARLEEKLRNASAGKDDGSGEIGESDEGSDDRRSSPRDGDR